MKPVGEFRHSGLSLNSWEAYPGALQHLPIPNKVLPDVSMDFIDGLPSSHGKLSPFLVFLDHVYKLHGMPATIDSDRDKGSSSVDLVDRTSLAREESIKLLKFYLKRAQDKMKIKADKHRTDKEFEVGVWVYLKIGKVAYRLQLPDYAKVHLVFHISQLKKCQSEDVHMGTFLVCTKQGVLAEDPLAVLDRRMRKKGNRAMVYLLIQ
ncbi:hypothetical protein Tco_1360045 [Tanacetum coccineum]